MLDAVTLDQLRTFIAAADEGSFSAAGRKLRRASQVMHSGDDCPRVPPTAKLPDVIYEMSKKGLGMTTVVDAEGRLTACAVTLYCDAGAYNGLSAVVAERGNSRRAIWARESATSMLPQGLPTEQPIWLGLLVCVNGATRSYRVGWFRLSGLILSGSIPWHPFAAFATMVPF